MYGSPQADILAQQLLDQRLNKHGYVQNQAFPRLWMHKTHPISFTLVVDDFGVKYFGSEHAMHLVNILEEHYKILEDWKGTKFIRLTLNWDYTLQKVHVSIPGYINNALTHFQHDRLKRKQICRTDTLRPFMERVSNCTSRPSQELYCTMRGWSI